MSTDRDLSALVGRQRSIGTAAQLRSLGLLASLIETGLAEVQGVDLAAIRRRVRAVAGDLELAAGRLDREART